jgi:hypothetical protein
MNEGGVCERHVITFGKFRVVFDGEMFWVKEGDDYVQGVGCEDHHYAFRIAHGTARACHRNEQQLERWMTDGTHNI